jgi:methionyl-tRNA formyltransferase
LISIPEGKLPDNSVNIRKFSNLNNIKFYETSDINSNKSIAYLKELQIDFILSTWPNLISNKVLSIPKYGVIGTHPTSLPINKGRHPLHWMIVMGRKQSTLSFFKMDEGIDSGNILIQEPFIIGDDINITNNNMCRAGEKGIKKLFKIFEYDRNFDGYRQDLNSGNYYRKRDEHDITIDPRMSGDMIIRIVNSFCNPYPGARLYLRKRIYVNIISAKILNPKILESNWENYEHGHLIKYDSYTLWLRVEDCVIELVVEPKNKNFEFNSNTIHPPAFYMD